MAIQVCLANVDKTALRRSPFLVITQQFFMPATNKTAHAATASVFPNLPLHNFIARAHGKDIPRDSGDQEHTLDNNVALGTQKSEDIVYWPGHTGILVDSETLLHATAHTLSCVVEPLHDVVERAGEISSIKRLFSH